MAGAVFGSIFMMAAMVLNQIYGDRNLVLARLEEYTEEARLDPVTEHLNRPFSERVLVPIWEKLLGLARQMSSPERKARYQEKLIAAGEPYGLDGEGMVVLKYGFLSGLALAGLLGGGIKVALVLGIAGYMFPDFLLNLWKTERREKILKSLPDVLDMLCVSVEAGLGFDAALQKVVDKIQGPLSTEFRRALNEIKLGKPRREALKDMVARLDVDDVSTFVGSLIQADQLGVSIANVLRVQAAQVREKRSQRAEEKAQKAPVKILIPLLFFIFPAIFIILLGPAVIQLIRTFG